MDRHPGPATTAHLNPEQARFRLFDSIATLVKHFARRGLLLILIDDLHDADLPSQTMLRFVARELSGFGARIVATPLELFVRR